MFTTLWTLFFHSHGSWSVNGAGCRPSQGDLPVVRMDVTPRQTEIETFTGPEDIGPHLTPSLDGKSEIGNGLHLTPILTHGPAPASGPTHPHKRLSKASEFWGGAHHKAWEKSPWVQLPLPEPDGRWIAEEQQATEWLSLFYGEPAWTTLTSTDLHFADLVVVAVLSVFSSNHELSSVSSVPNFLGFFTILYWVWVSQTHYDMRFQGDAYHSS